MYGQMLFCGIPWFAYVFVCVNIISLFVVVWLLILFVKHRNVSERRYCELFFLFFPICYFWISLFIA